MLLYNFMNQISPKTLNNWNNDLMKFEQLQHNSSKIQNLNLEKFEKKIYAEKVQL